MTSSSDAVKIQDLPFNKNAQPLVIQDSLVQKFQKTMKQYLAEHFSTGFTRMAMSEHVEWLQEVQTTVHLIHSVRCMRSIRPHNLHQHAYHITSGRCMHSIVATRSAAQSLGPACINAIGNYNPKSWHAVLLSSVPPFRVRRLSSQCPSGPPDEPSQPDNQQPPDQQDHPIMPVSDSAGRTHVGSTEGSRSA